MTGRRACLVGAGLATLAVCGCESTQEKSARLESAAAKVVAPGDLALGRPTGGLRIVRRTVLRGDGQSAVVVEIENRGSTTLVSVPVGIRAPLPGGRAYTNTQDGLEPLLLRIPRLGAGQRLQWVNASLPALPRAADVRIRLGSAKRRERRPAARLRVSGLRRTDPVTVSGRVTNAGRRAQTEVPVYVVVERDGRPVAAGTSQVPRIAGGGSATFDAPLVGDRGAGRLVASAVPTSTSSARSR